MYEINEGILRGQRIAQNAQRFSFPRNNKQGFSYCVNASPSYIPPRSVPVTPLSEEKVCRIKVLPGGKLE